ncbi:DUF1403 family protein [Mesorhizobium sp. M0496]|uniref:DUF1403 family protein n=1 Tax=Mesorhizobium sp. M0496 TaxID=2956952 RepID=UPI003337FF30
MGRRLALSATPETAKQAGRVEDGAALRDAVLLTRPGDNVGPAGLLLLARRRLAARPAEELLTQRNLAAVLEEFGQAHDQEAVRDPTDDLRHLAANVGTVGMMSGAIAIDEGHGLGLSLGVWLADALLAQRLGWAYAVSMLGAEADLGTGARRHRSAASSVAISVERS